MRTVGAYPAKPYLPSLLDEVEAGGDHYDYQARCSRR